MPYRPTASHRRTQDVIYPLTAAVERTYGARRDGAYPIGAFYTVNISSQVWQSVGGIWYRPYNPDEICGRNISEDAVTQFCSAIANGRSVTLPSGKQVTWEVIPNAEAAQLP